MTEPPLAKPKIFISYSRKDERWKDLLVEHLRPVAGDFEVWDDSQIEPGTDWLKEISRAIQDARVAILLISVAFLNSDFIRRREVPDLLKKHEKGGLSIFPVIVRDCLWKKVEWLSHLQALPRDGKSLARRAANRIETTLVHVVGEISTALEAPPFYQPLYDQHETNGGGAEAVSPLKIKRGAPFDIDITVTNKRVGGAGRDGERRALLVGIDQYENLPDLAGCAADAAALQGLLNNNEDGSPNYASQLLISPEMICQEEVVTHWKFLLDGLSGDALFYFSGQGFAGSLATYETQPGDSGLLVDTLLAAVNASNARSALMLLDCAYGGDTRADQLRPQINRELREGVTVLVTSRFFDPMFEVQRRGNLTYMIMEALRGGAADVRGVVTAAAIYGYVDQAVSTLDHRLYKIHARQANVVRKCRPVVPDSLLRELPSIFQKPDGVVNMDPSFEFTHPASTTEGVALFNKFKLLRNAHLLVTEDGKDLYFAALESAGVRLTPQGQFYWRLAKAKNV